MSTIIGLKELRDNMDAIAERTKQGESFTVVKRSRPIFELTPVSADASGRQQEIAEWTRQYIQRYKPAFEALAQE